MGLYDEKRSTVKTMWMIIFSAQNHDRQFFDKINRQQFTTQGFMLSITKPLNEKVSQFSSGKRRCLHFRQ
nr:hypothetical protein [Candidatus Hamiltonella defensa]